MTVEFGEKYFKTVLSYENRGIDLSYYVSTPDIDRR